MCHKKDEPAATQKSSSNSYMAHEISEFVKVKLGILNEKNIPISIIDAKLKINDLVSELEGIAK